MLVHDLKQNYNKWRGYLLKMLAVYQYAINNNDNSFECYATESKVVSPFVLENALGVNLCWNPFPLCASLRCRLDILDNLARFRRYNRL